MNRKEGIIVALVMLGSFVGGVFAPPAEQLLNVFVANFPQNEVITALDETRNVTLGYGDQEYFFAYDIDVSQAGAITVYLRLDIIDAITQFDVSDLRPLGAVVLGDNGDSLENHFVDDRGFTTLAVGTVADLTLSVKHPEVTQAFVALTCQTTHECHGTVRGQILIFLQKHPSQNQQVAVTEHVALSCFTPAPEDLNCSRVLPDGIDYDFDVPFDKVLVVTDVSWIAQAPSGASPGDIREFRIYLSTLQGTMAVLNVGCIVSPNNLLSGSEHLTTGFVASSVASIQVKSGYGGESVHLDIYGYLATP